MDDLYNSTRSKSLCDFHGFAPKQILKGKGVSLFDQDHNEFLDCGMALGSVSLGYAYDEVDHCVMQAIKKGVNFSRPSYLEEELTSLLGIILEVPIVARFSKSSSMLLSVIPRICRHLTKKAYIAYPLEGAYLGNTDWYFSKTNKSGGILQETKDKTLNFKNGDIESLYCLFNKHSNNLACIIMEPYRNKIHNESFYSELSRLCIKNNVILVFDETISGFRFGYPLAQTIVNCKADLTIIGKAFANGYALSAVVGENALMKKIHMSSFYEDLYGFSNTHAGETVGLAAAIKTLDIYAKKNVVEYLNLQGEKLMSMMKESIKNNKLDNIFTIKGQPSYFQLSEINMEGKDNSKKNIIKYFYDNRILFRGTMSMSLSHNETHINKIARIFEEYCQYNKIE